MIVIADTSPVNYLVLIGEIEVLPALFGRVLVPPSVCDELKRPHAPEIVRAWIARPPTWLDVREPTRSPDATLAHLDAGERDAILLAEELRADQLIIDEIRGRREASRRHLPYTGTLGVLAAGAAKGLLDLGSAVHRLRRTSFHISDDILDRLLKQQP
jgi:predicted nucleic acid-binding protein